jgi:hypothetical protein
MPDFEPQGTQFSVAPTLLLVKLCAAAPVDEKSAKDITLNKPSFSTFQWMQHVAASDDATGRRRLNRV